VLRRLLSFVKVASASCEREKGREEREERRREREEERGS
jgi:hypothetical protein